MTETKPHGYYTDKVFTPADMDAAIAKEREACIRIMFDYCYGNFECEQAAELIRARGQA